METVAQFRTFLNNFNMLDEPYVGFADPRLAVMASTIYVVFVQVYLSIRPYLNMAPAKTDASRQAWLKWLTVIHSSFLSILSLFMCVGILAPWIEVCMETGSECLVKAPPRLVGSSGFWIWVFVVSKYYEFVDTAFIMLRGHNIIFLHYWHHATVPLMTAILPFEDTVLFSTTAAYNSFVHVIMYAYYAYAATGRKSSVKHLVTTTQIMQFVVIFCHASYITYVNGFFSAPWTLGANFTVYLSFLVLFVKFYLENYSGSKKSVKKTE